MQWCGQNWELDVGGPGEFRLYPSHECPTNDYDTDDFPYLQGTWTYYHALPDPHNGYPGEGFVEVAWATLPLRCLCGTQVDLGAVVGALEKWINKNPPQAPTPTTNDDFSW